MNNLILPSSRFKVPTPCSKRSKIELERLKLLKDEEKYGFISFQQYFSHIYSYNRAKSSPYIENSFRTILNFKKSTLQNCGDFFDPKTNEIIELKCHWMLDAEDTFRIIQTRHTHLEITHYLLVRINTINPTIFLNVWKIPASIINKFAREKGSNAHNGNSNEKAITFSDKMMKDIELWKNLELEKKILDGKYYISKFNVKN